MTISEDTIEKIRLSNNIEFVVREYLPDLKKIGHNWKTHCPFHNEKTPSFVVSPEKGIFRCFGCNVAGDVFKFVMYINNISWIEAVKKLAEKANITIQETKQDEIRASERMKLFSILENSAMFYHKYLREEANAQKAREYLKKRGVKIEAVNKFQLGFSSNGQFLQWALKKGYTTDDLLKVGLIAKTRSGGIFEYMLERVIFPIFDLQGRVIGFGGRTITDQEPKYLNTSETVIYSKSSNLYGLFQTLPEFRKERKAIVLEGYMDVIIPQQFGIRGAVATLGTAFTQSHAKLLAKYSDSVTLLFDSDNAGRIATQRALEILVENGVRTKVSALPENVDADEYLNQYGKENFFKLIEDTSKSAIDFMIAKLCENLSSYGEKNSSEKKAKAMYNLLDFVAKSSSVIIQRDWIKNIAHDLNIDEEAVWNEFKRKQEQTNRNYSSKNSKNLIPYFMKDKKTSMSLEENLLNFILSNRYYSKRVDKNCFQNERCARVFNLVLSGLSDVRILNALPQEDKNWFSELVLNAIKYNNIEESFEIILKDIKLNMLERKRQQLEKEVLMMSDGKKEKDMAVVNEYNKLTFFLKGSRK
jgi:DNA primase